MRTYGNTRPYAIDHSLLQHKASCAGRGCVPAECQSDKNGRRMPVSSQSRVWCRDSLQTEHVRHSSTPEINASLVNNCCVYVIDINVCKFGCFFSCACLCVCPWCISTCLCVCPLDIYVYVCLCVHVCLPKIVYVRASLCGRACLNVCVCARLGVCACVC